MFNKILRIIPFKQLYTRYNFSSQIPEFEDIHQKISYNIQKLSNLVTLYEHKQEDQVYVQAFEFVKNSISDIQYFDQEQLAHLATYLKNLNIETEDYSDKIKSKLFQLMRQKLISPQNVVYISNTNTNFQFIENEQNLISNYIFGNFNSFNQESYSHLIQLYSDFHQKQNQQIWNNILEEGDEAIKNMEINQLARVIQGMTLSLQYDMPQNQQTWETAVKRLIQISPYQLNQIHLDVIIQSLGCAEIEDEQLWNILKQKTLENIEQLSLEEISRILEGIKHRQDIQDFFFEQLENYVINKINDINEKSYLTLISAYCVSQQGGDQIWHLLDQKTQTFLNSLGQEEYFMLLISVINKSSFLQKNTVNQIYEKYSQFNFDDQTIQYLRGYFIELQVDPVILETYFKNLAKE